MDEISMIRNGMKKARRLRIISFLLVAGSITLRIIHGVKDSGLIYMAVFGVAVAYAIISALTLFPDNWRRRAFEPARQDIDNRNEIEKLEDKIEFKIAIGWLDVFLMAVFAIGIYTGC